MQQCEFFYLRGMIFAHKNVVPFMKSVREFLLIFCGLQSIVGFGFNKNGLMYAYAIKKRKKEGETKLSSKLISQDERTYARRRAVPASRAPCM
jgi:hypothetical protein